MNPGSLALTKLGNVLNNHARLKDVFGKMAIILIINSDESSGKTKTACVAENKTSTCCEVGYMAEENRVHFVTEVRDSLKKTCPIDGHGSRVTLAPTTTTPIP